MSKDNKSRKRKANTGSFRQGPDPRRHSFTAEERSRGFWNAIQSIAERHPDAVDSSGRHMAVNFGRYLRREGRMRG